MRHFFASGAITPLPHGMVQTPAKGLLVAFSSGSL
jgi:hypothetical protein